MRVSSAYRFEAVSLKACGRSLIYIKKRSGPRIEPCGTPHVIKPSSKKESIEYYKKFSFRKIGFEPFNDWFFKANTLHFFKQNIVI